VDFNKDRVESYAYSQEERSLDLLEGNMAEALAYWVSLSSDGKVPTWEAFDLNERKL